MDLEALPRRRRRRALSLRVVSIMAELLAVAGAELAALALARHERRAAAPASPPPADRCLPYLDAPAIVVVPTYEEREALVLFVERFATTGMDLLIVDDSSPDGTGELAVALAAARPWMHVLHRADKDGLGMAYRAGFTWCLEGGYGVIGQMDCDLSHPPEKLAEMRRALDERGEEVPFVFSERVAGASKMTLRISLEGIRVTLALRRNRRPSHRHGPSRPCSLRLHARR